MDSFGKIIFSLKKKNYIPSRIITFSGKKIVYPLGIFCSTPQKYIHIMHRSENNVPLRDTDLWKLCSTLFEFEQLFLMWAHSISFWLATSQKTTVKGGLSQGLPTRFDPRVTLSRHSPLRSQAHSLHP